MAENRTRDTAKVMGKWAQTGVVLDDVKLDLPARCSVGITFNSKEIKHRKPLGTVEMFTVNLAYVCLDCNFVAYRKEEFDQHKCAHDKGVK